MSDSDSDNEQLPQSELLPATTELAQSAQKKTYKKHTENDRRRETSKANIEKARAARLERIRKEKEADKDKYVIEESSSEEEDDDTELVLKKAKKPKQLTEVEARMLKLELLLENLALQEKKKKLQDKKKPKKIEIEVKQPVAVKKEAPSAAEHVKKRMLLDL